MKQFITITLALLLIAGVVYATETSVKSYQLYDDYVKTSTTTMEKLTTLSNLVTVGTLTTGTWQGNVVDHERGGLEANVSAYTGLLSISGGSTAETDTLAEVNALLPGEIIASSTGHASIVTVGTLTTGSTGAGFTIDVGNSTISGTLNHEYGGLEADVNAYTGLLAISGGNTSEVDAKSELEAQIADVADFAEADGDVWTGVHDFGGATSIEIVNAAGPTVNAAGEIAIDTTDDQLIYYGSAVRVIPYDFKILIAEASSTLAYYGAYGSAGTTTMEYTALGDPWTVVDISTSAKSGTTSVSCGDGTNWMSFTLGGDDTGYTSITPSANNTFTADENYQCRIGTQEGDPKDIYIRIKGTWDVQ